MKRRTAIRFILIAGAVFLFDGRTQSVEADNPPDFVIHSDVRLVLLDVSVKDRDGGWVTDLSKEDFHVAENGANQNITVFARNDVPVTIGLLIDNSRSMIEKRAEVLSAALTFIRESNPQDEIFVLNFNDTVKRGLPKDILFSDDIHKLRSAISSGIPDGRTALNDAVVDGLEQLKLGKRDKKALILISDGGDNASRHDRAATFETVERDLATIYTIGLFTPDDSDSDPGILKKLAKVTGGIAYFPKDAPDLTSACKNIAKDVRTRYTVGYLPPPDNGGSLRRVRVHVSAAGRTGLSARTRLSYRYEDTANKQ